MSCLLRNYKTFKLYLNYSVYLLVTSASHLFLQMSSAIIKMLVFFLKEEIVANEIFAISTTCK